MAISYFIFENPFSICLKACFTRSEAREGVNKTLSFPFSKCYHSLAWIHKSYVLGKLEKMFPNCNQVLWQYYSLDYLQIASSENWSLLRAWNGLTWHYHLLKPPAMRAPRDLWQSWSRVAVKKWGASTLFSQDPGWAKLSRTFDTSVLPIFYDFNCSNCFRRELEIQDSHLPSHQEGLVMASRAIK